MDRQPSFIIQQLQELNAQGLLEKAGPESTKKSRTFAKSVVKKQLPFPADKFARASRWAGGLVGWLAGLAGLAGWLAGERSRTWCRYIHTPHSNRHLASVRPQWWFAWFVYVLLLQGLGRKGCGLPCDLWGLGVIAYILFSGQTPFDGPDKKELLRAICEEPLSFDDSVWKSTSAGARAFIRKLLIRNPEARPCAEDALRDEWLAFDGS